ncbi:interleukin-15 [Neoarius graeffei]|uniref:interleukin-15 n=1 Tax=Neoarius graeffei TaxID=443677 RepID=UPI00298D391B|nr:interleukin-15 [Neoarius graeffei]XP_060782492.1 interleukin-15 [Neoarius graeffei]XP_060782493.1 interleukin-15 [Neoarius graeffei]
MALVDIAPMSFLLLFLILISGFGNKPKKHKSKRTLRCIYVVWGVGSNLECHINLEGWNSFLLLSCLSVFATHVDAHGEQSLRELQEVLRNMTPLFNVSKASLYAPLPNLTGCTKKLMYCYLLELNVILHEEEGDENDLSVIHSLKKEYSSSNSCSECLACEEHPLVNSTMFSERIQEFVQKLFSVLGNSDFKDCD